ncbi:MAG: MurR/RpiR family transcriptional regulator [Rhodoferax sp.]|nr:MurR/RpiR family transcriptional regulator [Rhodoferax sp.]MBP6493377.1 MurR/RpiR family transcriptional regulator [Rhodoferax sp.]
MTPRVLEKIAEIMDRAPAARRTVLALILEDPQRVLDETFETLAQRANSSVPTIMRTCRDLGYPGLREFKLALAQALAVGGSPLNRRVRIDDNTQQVITKVTRGAAVVINNVHAQLDAQAVQAAADAMVAGSRIDCYGVGVTSNFMASDLQARLYRLGLTSNAYLDPHLQLISAATIGPRGVVMAITYVGGMPSLLEAVDVARSQGATIIALTQPGSQLAGMADIVLSVEVAPDPVMPVGPEAYLAHLTVIEILTVLVAQRLGDKAVNRLSNIQRTLETRGLDMRHHPRLDWGDAANGLTGKT